MPYIMYLRKSRADLEAEARGEQETLARHRKILLDLAARNGHTIDREYPEIVSGETIAARPQMQQLLADIAAGGIDGVYVMDIERLARGDAMDQGRIAQVFLYSDTLILTPQKVYRPDNESDAEYLEFGLFMSRREYKSINRRIQAGRRQSLKEGKYICSRPAYGYRKVRIEGDRGYTLEVCPEEAEVVRWVFDLCIQGEGLTRIAGKLADMGVAPGEQGQRWTPTRIYRMITNEVYIGKIRWGRVKTQRLATAEGVKKRLALSRDYELYDGMHDAIITQDVFDAAQQRLRSYTIPMRRDMALSNPLSGILRCSECGHFMRGIPAVGRQMARVKCATRECPTVQNYLAPVEDAILDALRGWLRDYQMRDQSATTAQPTDDASAGIRAELAAYERQRTELMSRKDTLCSLLERGIYDELTFTERFAKLQAEIKTIETDIQKAKTRITAMPSKYCDMDELAPRIEYILKVYDSADAAQRNAMLREVISTVDYTKTQKGLIIQGRTLSDANQFNINVYPRLKE